MIQLTQRQQTILVFLLTADAVLPVRTLADKYYLSPRTIRYDLDRIETYLTDIGGRLIKLPGLGISVEAGEKLRQKLLEDAGCADISARVFSRDERQDYIVRRLMLHTGVVTAEELAMGMYVSRTTALSDLHSMDKRLSASGLSLKSKKGEGFWLDGCESNIRRCIVDTLYSMLPAHYASSTKFITESLLGKLPNDGSDLSFVAKYLCGAQIDLLLETICNANELIPYSMQAGDHVKLLFYFAVAVTRIHTGHIVSARDGVQRVDNDSRESQLGNLLAWRIGVCARVTMNADEAYHISVWLISCNIKFPPKQNDVVRLKLAETVDFMLEVLADHHDYHLPEFYLDKLKVNLMSHLKLSIKKYNMQISTPNPLLIQMKVNYPEIFMIVYRMTERFEERTGIALGEDETGYIAIHIAACVEECSRLKTKKALIVCNTGRGAAMVLQNRIYSNIPRLELQGTVAAIDVMDGDMLRLVDLVISTIDLPDIGKPVFRVSPIISNAEMSRINNYLNGNLADSSVENIRSSQKYMLSMVLQQTDKYVDIDDRKKLENDLMGILGLAEVVPAQLPSGYNHAETAALHTAMIMARLGGIAGDMSELFGIDFSYDKVFGLAIHLLMSIPRWEKGLYTRERSSDELITNHPEIYEYIVHLLRETSQECVIAIPDREALSIMRYFL